AAGIDAHAQRSQSYVDVEKLDNEFVLTSAEYFLSLANINWTFTAPFGDLCGFLLMWNTVENLVQNWFCVIASSFGILFGNASFADMELSGYYVICFVNTVCFPTIQSKLALKSGA
ncbi:hypothetical protein U1Q18_025018, partial [Sarracenia purpurea var. burkii]